MMMHDQAQRLRDRIQNDPRRTHGKRTRVLTIASGKGGAGKSNFTLNFAIELQSRGYKVLVFDADLGMANIDVLMGATPPYTLYDVLKKEQTIESIIYKGYKGLAFISGGSGFQELMFLCQEELNAFSAQIQQLNGEFDFILFDTGAGLSKQTLTFIAASEQTIVVTTPEPPAIQDAYAIMKAVHTLEPTVKFQLVVNRIADRKEGKVTADKLRVVAQRFLHIDLATLGFIPEDTHVPRAVKQQVPFALLYPESAASRYLKEVVTRFEQIKLDTPVRYVPLYRDPSFGMRRFFQKVIGLMH